MKQGKQGDGNGDPAVTRRELLVTSGVVAGAAVIGGLQATPAEAAVPMVPAVQTALGGFAPRARALAPGLPNRDYMPVVVPIGTKCPWKIVNGVKVFHLVAEEFEHEFAPGLKATCWGYNKQVNGPVLEMVEGDHVRVYLTNRLIATVLVAVGQTRTIEMVPLIPGDWAMHCHMTHHVMNQMGQGPRPTRELRGPRLVREPEGNAEHHGHGGRLGARQGRHHRALDLCTRRRAGGRRLSAGTTKATRVLDSGSGLGGAAEHHG